MIEIPIPVRLGFKYWYNNMEKQTNVSASGYGWGSTVELQMAWRRQARSKWATWFDKNLNKPHMGRFSETNVPEQNNIT